jgi:hypothetical protein
MPATGFSINITIPGSLALNVGNTLLSNNLNVSGFTTLYDNVSLSQQIIIDCIWFYNIK